MNLREQDLEFEKTLEESKTLLDDASREADEDYEFTLEGILAEYNGQSGAKKAVPPPGAAPPKPAVRMSAPSAPQSAEAARKSGAPPAQRLTETPKTVAKAPPKPAEAAGEEIAPAVDTPQSYTLKELLERTVQDVLDEKEPLVEETPKRGLFGWKRARDTEAFYENTAHLPKEKESPAPEPFHVEAEPEPPISETLEDYRDASVASRRALHGIFFLTVLSWLPSLLDRFSLMPELYRENQLVHLAPFLVILLVICVLGREVFAYAWDRLCSLRLSYELMTSLLCLGAMADLGLCLLLPERSSSPAQPLYAIAALSMSSAMWGRSLLFRAMYDAFRIAAIGDASYILTPTAGGAAKRRGSVNGFTTLAQRDDLATRWQTLTLPVILTAVIVFTALATTENGVKSLCFWNFTAILAGANALAFPLVYALPLKRVTARFAKSGGALAGYSGAELICRSNCMILTDTDLFPRGTVTLNGLKIFGEDSRKVISYAATMANAMDSGISPLFQTLLEQEGGKTEKLTDLNYYEEGGVGGTIRGETVLFGTSSFCRKMGVTLPHGLPLKTGMFLVLDGTLIAVFAVKYLKSENVDWALHAIRRARLTPVLAVRDGNITPELLKRKFDTDARAIYPPLSTRLALSEKGGGRPCALIYREGLAPYADLAVGSKRLCRAVRIGNIMTLIASVAGTMVSFYLSFVAAYSLFTPFALLMYLILWSIAALIDGVFVDKY